MITNLKARVNPTLRETLWRSCRDLSTDRNAIIANGDTVRNKRKKFETKYSANKAQCCFLKEEKFKQLKW